MTIPQTTAKPAKAAVPGGVWVAAVLATTTVFLFDMFTPLGVAGGAPYVTVILLGLWTRSRAFVLGYAALALVLVVLGMVLSPEGLDASVYQLNRGITVFAIAACAALVLYHQHLALRLRSAGRALEESRRGLAASEQQIKAIVANAVEGIITIDERGIMRMANKAAQSIFGYDEPELIGNNVSMLMPSPDREQHDGYIRKYIETGVAGIIGKGREVVGLRKDGQRIPIYLSVSDVRDSAGVFTGIVRDLTEEKRLQRRIVEQEALATLGRMAAVVAHEVKNPLAGMSGVIQILRSRMPEDSEDALMMSEMLERIGALVQTIEDMLMFARPRELRPQRVRIVEVLNETAKLVTNDKQAAGVEIDIPDSDIELNVDVDYLREALLNVFLNAAQAMGGTGVIRTEVVPLEGFCCVRVTDTGPGIPEHVRGRIFEPFFTTKGRGTGLGLSLVKSVVERHGGEVILEFPKQGGTIVRLKLPHPTGGVSGRQGPTEVS